MRVHEAGKRRASVEVDWPGVDGLPPGLLERPGKNDLLAADQQRLDPRVVGITGVDGPAEDQQVCRGTRVEHCQHAPQAEMNFHQGRLIEGRDQRERRLWVA